MLDINLTAVLTQSIGFILLAWFLGKFAFPPIQRILAEREKLVSDQLASIEADRTAMHELREDYSRRLANIEAEAREHITRGIKQAQEEASAILAQSQADAAEQRDRALADIDQERKKALAEIRTEMSSLAVLAATRILEREINPEVHRGLIDDFIGDVSARPAAS